MAEWFFNIDFQTREFERICQYIDQWVYLDEFTTKSNQKLQFGRNEISKWRSVTHKCSVLGRFSNPSQHESLGIFLRLVARHTTSQHAEPIASRHLHNVTVCCQKAPPPANTTLSTALINEHTLFIYPFTFEKRIH